MIMFLFVFFLFSFVVFGLFKCFGQLFYLMFLGHIVKYAITNEFLCQIASTNFVP